MNAPKQGLTVTLAATLLLGILLAALLTDGTLLRLHRKAAIEHISSLEGKQLPSLFAGVPPNPRIVRLQARLDARVKGQSCGAPGKFARALAFFGIHPSVVHAQGLGECEWLCGAAGCGGEPLYEACAGQGCHGTYTYGYVGSDYDTFGDEGVGNRCYGLPQLGCGGCYAMICPDCTGDGNL